MVLVLRFLMEVDKARNSLDLNKGPGDEGGDHIVPTYAAADNTEDIAPYVTPVQLVSGYNATCEAGYRNY